MPAYTVTIRETRPNGDAWTSTHDAISEGEAQHAAVQHHFGATAFWRGDDTGTGQVWRSLGHTEGSTSDTGRAIVTVDPVRLTDGASVAREILAYESRYGTCPSAALIASALGCSHRTVQTRIRELVADGVLVTRSEGAGSGATQYDVYLDRLATETS